MFLALLTCAFLPMALSFYTECALDVFPLPQNCSVGDPSRNITVDPCSIVYRIYTPQLTPHLNQLLNQYMNKSYNCSQANVVLFNNTVSSFSGYVVDILVLDPSFRSVYTTVEQTYMINADKNGTVIRAGTYVSVIRGVDTFLQLIINQPETSDYSIGKLPIYIFDQPQFTHRGVMIDTARHYFPFDLILQTIDSMVYNKMNVLHWHITDEDSFPLVLDKHPELAQYGAFSQKQVYTKSQAKEVVRYAKVRGIRVVPQLDTPGHASSWGRAPKNKGLACTFNDYTFQGPLDVTLDQTYQLVNQVFEEILQIFPDPYIHLGGDEVRLTCLSNLTFVLKQNNITVQDLPIYYRQRQKKIISSMNSSKQRMYWQNNFDHIKTYGPNDVIHWWGDANLPETTSKIVISTFGPFYIDMGVGNYFGMPYGLYSNWLDLYNQNIWAQISGYSNKANVLGAEVLLWSQLDNKYTHMTKLWIRSSSVAQRLWNPHVEIIKPRVIRRLNYHMARMNRRGIPTSPITSQACEYNAEYC